MNKKNPDPGVMVDHWYEGGHLAACLASSVSVHMEVKYAGKWTPGCDANHFGMEAAIAVLDVVGGRSLDTLTASLDKHTPGAGLHIISQRSEGNLGVLESFTLEMVGPFIYPYVEIEN